MQTIRKPGAKDQIPHLMEAGSFVNSNHPHNQSLNGHTGSGIGITAIPAGGSTSNMTNKGIDSTKMAL